MKSFLLSLFFIPAFCLGQKDNPENLSVAEYDLTADSTAPASVQLPFSSIQVIDSRFDTSKLGFVYSDAFLKGKRRLFKKAQLKNGIAGSITNFYNNYYKNSFRHNDFSLLIVMKKCWLSQTGIYKPEDERLATSYDFQSVYIKWEYYIAKAGQYLPVKRVDTVLQVTKAIEDYVRKNKETASIALLKLILKAQVELLDFNKGIIAFDEQPKKSMDWINTYNRSRFNIPILTENAARNGIYLNFNQFINNTPAIINFKETKTGYYEMFKRAKYVAVTENNTAPDYWCYFLNGSFKYGKSENEPLYRNGNSFQFFHRNVDIYYSTETLPVLNSNLPYSQRNITEEWVPYQIDMETGKFY